MLAQKDELDHARVRTLHMEADPLHHMIILICTRPAPEADFARMKMMVVHVRPTGKSPNVGTIFPGLPITCELTVHVICIA